MARLPAKVNYAKLTYEAEKTKSKVKQNKIEAYAKWQKKLGGKSRKLDKLDDNLRKLRKTLEDFEKKQVEDAKALRSLLRMIEGAYKELQVYRQVPVDSNFPPPPPKNQIALGSMIAVVGAMIVYLAAVKSYMALAEALSKDKG